MHFSLFFSLRLVGVPVSMHIQLTQPTAQIPIIHILTAIKAGYIKTIDINKIIGRVITSQLMNRAEIQQEQLGMATVTTAIPMTCLRSKDFTTLVMPSVSRRKKAHNISLSFA
jgi:hypothetical protein